MYTDSILLVVVALFVGTQAVYLLSGLVLDWLVVFGARHTINEPAIDPDDRITVLVTLSREPRAVLEETLASLAEQAYDLSLVRIILVHEADDSIVTGYLDDVIASDTESWQLEGFAVERSDMEIPLWLDVLTALNLLNWGWYTAVGYLATLEAVWFRDHRRMLWYFVVSNPLTQSLYALLWSIPFGLAVRDHVTGVETTFEVTPKSVAPAATDANATSLRPPPQN